MVKISSFAERGIYTDLLRCFIEQGNEVCVVCPIERRLKLKTNLSFDSGNRILYVRTLNLTKTNIVEKGLATLAIESQFLNAVKKFYNDDRFDLILYSTPPITFYKVIDYIKKRDNAFSYLLLKDIFPQNAVDMRMFKKNGFLYKYFRIKEQKLYSKSDAIGCMSEANKNYLLKHNSYLADSKIEVNPNSIQPVVINKISYAQKSALSRKYSLPIDKKIFVYGGNLGKPQGLSFLLKVIQEIHSEKIHFLIVGQGTEYKQMHTWFRINKPSNATLLKALPKDEYDSLLSICDVGLIFLHPDFTIPNFPSRLLSYLEMRMPVIAATDAVSDIGDVIEEYKCGIKVLSGQLNKMIESVYFFTNEDKCKEAGEASWRLLQEKYVVTNSYKKILNRIKERSN